MRLSWLVFAFAIIAVGLAQSSSTDAPTSTQPAETTTQADDVQTTTTASGTANTETEAPKTDGPTDEPVDPVTSGPEPTDDGSTGETKATEKTTAKVVTTVKTTVKAGSTTTKEPEPDVERFNVHCEQETCTYTMQVPGLDIDTFNGLMSKTNQTEEDVNTFENSDLVNLQAGVTKVFDDAKVTADYIESQLEEISIEVSDLQTQASQLETAINTLNTAVYNANKSLNKILANKGSCLYRQCVLKETTTPKPKTTTTTRFVPIPYCDRPENKGICQNGGTCVTWYDSYYCTCPGNLDGQENDCYTSVCDIVNDAQEPGPIVSPGYYIHNSSYVENEDGCSGDGAQWKIKTDSSKVLTMEGTNFAATDNISHLTSDAFLQLVVGKFKLKITKSTKFSQIKQILEYGPSATITYNGPSDSFFHFTITNMPAPPPSPTPPKA